MPYNRRSAPRLIIVRHSQDRPFLAILARTPPIVARLAKSGERHSRPAEITRLPHKLVTEKLEGPDQRDHLEDVTHGRPSWSPKASSWAGGLQSCVAGPPGPCPSQFHHISPHRPHW